MPSISPSILPTASTPVQYRPKFGRIELSRGAQVDVKWFSRILEDGRLSELPLSLFGSRCPARDIHLYMDASNLGLAVLDPTKNEYIQVQFDSDEVQWIDNSTEHDNQFSINVREYFCVALAIWIWEPTWCVDSRQQTIFVKCWSDNTSAVLWTNTLNASNHFSQELARSIGLAKAMFNIRAHASHLPGSSNIAADAASRAWVSPFAKTWTNFSASWSQITVPASLRRIYQNFSTTFNPNHWPKARTSSIPVYGGNGSSGVKNYNTQWGYHPNQHDTRTNSVYSPSTTGKTGGSMNHPEIQLLPSSPRAVICHGIISASSSTLLGCSPVIVSQPQERDEKKELQPKEHPSQSSFCKKFTAVSTSPTSTAASFGGLPSWAGSFFSGDRNILP